MLPFWVPFTDRLGPMSQDHWCSCDNLGDGSSSPAMKLESLDLKKFFATFNAAF